MQVSDVLESVKLAETLGPSTNTAAPSLRLQKHSTVQREVETLVKDNEHKLQVARTIFAASKDTVEEWITDSIAHNYKVF